MRSGDWVGRNRGSWARIAKASLELPRCERVGLEQRDVVEQERKAESRVRCADCLYFDQCAVDVTKCVCVCVRECIIRAVVMEASSASVEGSPMMIGAQCAAGTRRGR